MEYGVLGLFQLMSSSRISVGTESKGPALQSPFLHLLRAFRKKIKIHKSPMLKHMWIFEFSFFDRKSSKNL